MSPFFYFNGFNSAIPEDWSLSPKIAAAANYARRRGYLFRPVSINYREIEGHIAAIRDEALGATRRAVFCGSSMGGWLARIMQLLTAREAPGPEVLAIAWNPAFDLRDHGHMLEGQQQNFVTLERYEWKARDTARLQALEARVDYGAPLPYYVYVDKGDEVIDWQASARRHRPIARFVAFEGGNHGFEHYEEALADFDRELGEGTAGAQKG